MLVGGSDGVDNGGGWESPCDGTESWDGKGTEGVAVCMGVNVGIGWRDGVAERGAEGPSAVLEAMVGGWEGGVGSFLKNWFQVC